MKYKKENYLKTAHFVVMHVLLDNPGIQSREVSDKCDYSREYARSILTDLVKKELVKKKHNKFYMYFLTKEGFRVIDVHNKYVQNDTN